jgi:hypothetical protein
MPFLLCAREMLSSACRRRALPAALALLAIGGAAGAAPAADVGAVKVSKGTVHVERGGRKVPAPVGFRIQTSDVVVTGPDGSVGIAFADNSVLSAGPDTVLVIDKFAFDSTTHAGQFETVLRQGTLSAVSGKISRQTPEAMKVRTPAAVLGVRGTELLVRTGAAGR